MVNWRKIKTEYLRGGISYRQLCEKYGVSFSSLSRRALKEKWTDLKKQSDEKSTSKIIESVVESDAKRVDQFNAIADKLLKKIDKLIEDPDLLVNIRSLRDITGAIKDLREIKGCKSELDMKEQIARIEKLRKEAQVGTGDNEDKGYGVFILPEVGDLDD